MKHVGRPVPSAPWTAPVGIVVVLLAIVFSMVREHLIPFRATGERRTFLLTGDEPEYLLAATSLVRDGDMNLHNNVRDDAWRAFQDRPPIGSTRGNLNHFVAISPRMARVAPERWTDRQLLIHRPGTAVLVAPAAWSTRRPRWWAYLIVSSVLLAGAAILVAQAVRAGASRRPTALVVTMLALSPPGFFYANPVFPEIPMAVLLAAGFSMLWTRGRTAAVLAAGAAALAPWFSDRVIPAAACLGVAALLCAPDRRGRVTVALLLLAGAAVLAAYYHRRFGVPFPVHHHPRLKASPSFIPEGLPRVLLDGSRGLIWLFPALVLAPVAFLSWWQSGFARIPCLLLALAAGTSLLMVASFPDWRGGTCPAGRYGVLVQWLALPAFLAWARAGISRRQAGLLAIPLVAGVFQSAWLLRRPNWWYRPYHPLLANSRFARFAEALPWFDLDAPGTARLALLWTGVFVAYAVLVWRLRYSATPATTLRVAGGCRGSSARHP